MRVGNSSEVRVVGATISFHKVFCLKHASFQESFEEDCLLPRNSMQWRLFEPRKGTAIGKKLLCCHVAENRD